MTSRDVPVSQQRLFVGRFSLGPAPHAPADADLPAGVPPLRRADGDLPGGAAHGRTPGIRAVPVSKLAKALAWDSSLNPVRPLPPVGGMPRLHGIEPHEVDVTLPLAERVGHSLVLGTTRVGKNRPPSCSSPRTSAARWAASTRS